MPDQDDYFSADYGTARSRFREAVQVRGGRLTALDIDASGPDGSVLTIDIGWLGAEYPRHVLQISSGLHGVEGFAGSAAQLRLLDNFRKPPSDGAVVLVHALNPFGMAWLRRVNESNVDLNRNFLAPGDAYTGSPPGYGRLDSMLNPPTPPARDLFLMRALWELVRHGMSPLKQAIAGGQYDYPNGLFFGGQHLERGPRLIQDFVTERFASVTRLVAIDVHTGLGQFGDDVLLVEADRVAELRAYFGRRVTPLDAGQGPAYRIRGGFRTMLARSAPAAHVYFASQEFGTFRAISMLSALREENRSHHYGSDTVDDPAKRRLKSVFCPDDPGWRRQVLERNGVVLERAFELAFAEAQNLSDGITH